MVKNEFKVTSIFKIIVRICKKNFGFCGKKPNFYPEDIYSFSAFFI